MTYKKGDRFLIEVKVVKTHDSESQCVIPSNGVFFYVSNDILRQSQKIEPVYEDGEWYWGRPDLEWERRPWIFSEGRFHPAYGAPCSYLPSQMYWIGPKIERPEEWSE